MSRDRRQVKRATELLVEDLGGCEKAGALVGKGKSSVGRWYDTRNPDNEGYTAPVGDVREMEANASQPFATMALCRLAGGVFVPHIDAAADEGSLAWLALQLSRRLGELSGEIAMALANDGAVDPAEAERILGVQDEHDRVSAQLRRVMQGVIAAAPPKPA